ncbi:EAL domain-containing protein [Aquaspirillum soli]
MTKQKAVLTPLLTASRASVILFLLYLLSGWVSLLLIAPPGYAIPIYPPAGFALAFALIYGVRVWPAVLFGSIGIQWLLNTSQPMSSGIGWPMLSFIPLGAVLQMWVGHRLAKTLLPFPYALDTPSSIARFLLIIAPLGCLISAGVGIATLYFAGHLKGDDLGFNLWSWWIGDTLGVLIVTPLVFALLGQPRSDWIGRRLVIVLPLIVALSVVAVAHTHINRWEKQRLASEFERDANHLSQLLSHRLRVQNDMVFALERFLILHRNLTAADFKTFVSAWLPRYPGSQNIGWSPMVPESQRTTFEQHWQQQLQQPDFSILVRDPNGKTFPAPTASHYLPILFVEPLQKNLSVRGLDPLGFAPTRSAIETALHSGNPSAAQAIRLVQEAHHQKEQRGIAVYHAVYAPAATPNEKPTWLGVISTVFRMDDVLQATLGNPSEQIEICLVDIFSPPSKQRLSGPDGCQYNSWLAGHHPIYRETLQFSGREWELRLRPTELYLAHKRTWAAWFMLAASLGSVAVLGAFLLLISGRTRRVEEHIEYLAHYDVLTNLPNRNLWRQQAEEAIGEAQKYQDKLAILFLDLDHFKTVNDSLGHPVGDQLLTIVADRLSSCLRQEDVLARQGGDEFVLVLPALDNPQQAGVVAQRMLTTLGQKVDIEGHELKPSMSIGIAIYPEDGEDIDTLLRHADLAMYSAKADGRNSYRFFEEEMNARALERLMLESALRRAIERDELVLFYQAQFDTEQQGFFGCEALVRWRHPEMGMILPAQFIPVAEESGLIVPMGEWILREACRQQVRWQMEGKHIIIAINISALQFAKPDFVTTVAKILQETEADPAFIELEITESALMQNSEVLQKRLQALRDLGLTLALDDFGTGYSCLAYLKQLPISRIKLDRSFVKELPTDSEDIAIASATLSLAHNLGMEVVAEGVENEDQKIFLEGLGCRFMQGYFFARPTAPDHFLHVPQLKSVPVTGVVV